MTIDDSSLTPRSPDTVEPEPAAAQTDIALPQDLRAPWGWLDLLLLGVLGLASSVLLTRALVRVFAIFGMAAAQIKASPSALGLFTVIHQALLFIIVLGYLIAQVRVNFRAPFWRTIGWRALEPGQVPRALRYLGFIVGGFMLALLVELVSIRFGTKAKLPVQALFQDRRTALLLMLMAVLVAPVIEETIFRGYIYPVVARSYGVTAGVLSTGILFGLLHAPQLWGGWVQISMLVLVGIVLTYARAATKTVLASYLLHLSYNFFISFAVVIISQWLRLLSPRH